VPKVELTTIAGEVVEIDPSAIFGLRDKLLRKTLPDGTVEDVVGTQVLVMGGYPDLIFPGTRDEVRARILGAQAPPLVQGVTGSVPILRGGPPSKRL